VRQDAEQRVVDFVRRAQGELRKRGVLFVFSKLGLELNFVLIEFALFVESAEEFFLRDVAFLLALLRQGARARSSSAESLATSLRCMRQITNRMVAVATAKGRR
jgi:hypothetical protein